ncbi:hypothetical protein chiPu_0016429 [Chiloscyllium punctatum]|uniref:Tetraspanin n=1 Tax=Chiloscyllium punctatum TaxID=137246 RepID=A0A401T5K3_CHIPU|nr:hypothetical protein [Chiloscyllium punctatum]
MCSVWRPSQERPVRTVSGGNHSNRVGSDDQSFGVYTLIATGALMMLVGFLGCCGVVHESQCLLGAFFMCLLVIFVAEITAGVWGFLNKHEILQEMSGYYSKSLQAYKMTGAGNRTLRAIHSVVSGCLTPYP